ncbi:MAG TPA: hypothetical protein VHO48_10460 [Anaerolineaceae bacterium]|nr:hypothetical protein [Anaerolineaceae bacterium]
MTVSALGTAYGAYQSLKSPAAPSMPGLGTIMPQGMTMGGMQLGGALPAIGRVGGTLVRGGVAGAKRIYSSAASYCRKHPGWCQTIGGIAAVEALVQQGQLPVMKSRRGRGITATELKNFRRVARFTSKYCAPVRRAMSSKAVRRGASCR